MRKVYQRSVNLARNGPGTDARPEKKARQIDSANAPAPRSPGTMIDKGRSSMMVDRLWLDWDPVSV